MSGTGLFLIMTISSSLNYLASSGMAQTRMSLTASVFSISMRSAEQVKIFFLKAGSLSMMLLRKAN